MMQHDDMELNSPPTTDVRCVQFYCWFYYVSRGNALTILLQFTILWRTEG